jgi:hypothetical protein
MVYSMPQSDFIWPLPSFDHNSWKSGLNEQYKGTLRIYVSKPFYWYPKGSIWCLFDFSTKALNIYNYHTNATIKVGVHLGVIRLHPLHFPSFVKMCFTPTHTFGLMGPYTSHFVMNPMLGL